MKILFGRFPAVDDLLKAGGTRRISNVHKHADAQAAYTGCTQAQAKAESKSSAAGGGIQILHRRA